MPRYVIFQGGGRDRAHSAVYLARAESLQEAMRRWVETVVGPGVLEWHPDGSLSERWFRKTVRYPHVLAYIEANEKIHREWQIREMPEWLLDLKVAEVFCGEDTTIDQYIEMCLPMLRSEFPRSRARAFVWYTTRGPLVTFHRGRRAMDYRVLRRYLLDWDRYPEPVPWEGDDAELCGMLDLRTIPEARPDDEAAWG